VNGRYVSARDAPVCSARRHLEGAQEPVFARADLAAANFQAPPSPRMVGTFGRSVPGRRLRPAGTPRPILRGSRRYSSVVDHRSDASRSSQRFDDGRDPSISQPRLDRRAGVIRFRRLENTLEDEHEERVMVPADIHPATLVLPIFAPSDMLSGRQPDGNFQLTVRKWIRESAAFDLLKKERGAKFAEVEATVKPQQFSRVLAKIAHAYAVARLGLNGFSPMLLDLIHGRDVIKGPELVGSDLPTPPPAANVLHELGLVPNPRFVVVRIRLFASFSADGHATPVYIVVAGEKVTRAE
jgi:hypothetical protein